MVDFWEIPEKLTNLCFLTKKCPNSSLVIRRAGVFPKVLAGHKSVDKKMGAENQKFSSDDFFCRFRKQALYESKAKKLEDLFLFNIIGIFFFF